MSDRIEPTELADYSRPSEKPASSPTVVEARRIMQICNACRYCEGFCDVFPAMTKRNLFSSGDLNYLSNLCHNCRGCYYACQYAPPHEFDVNVPKVFSELRAESWETHAWPSGTARLFHRNGLMLFMASALSIAAIFIISGWFHSPETFFSRHPDGNFYNIIPHQAMVWTAGPVFLFALFAMIMSIRSFWRETDSPDMTAKALYVAIRSMLSLSNLSGGGYGCNDDSERFSMTRRRLHHAAFYGFLLCFAATVLGTVYHYILGWKAPYPYASLPVLFGTVGGVSLCIGTAGLYWMNIKTENILKVPDLRGMETAFIWLLFFTSLSGLLLLAFRETSALGTLLALHLGFVLGLFLSLPYSKMVHGLYRGAALIRFHAEK